MQAAGYIRVSTENQLENYSIEEQSQRIAAYCKAKGWPLFKLYTDGGYSGGNVNRPALQEMLHDIRQGKLQTVVVYKLDRLSRSQKDTLTLIEDEFLSHHVDFVSINENFDTSTPLGRAMIGILSVFSQLEKDQITERFTMGRIGRSKAGYFHGGAYPPFGYCYRDGLLTIDPYQAEAVLRVFSLFLSGKSLHAIQREMEKDFPGRWSAAKVRGILQNSVYIGKVKFAGEEYDGLHEPILSREVFVSANRLLCSSERKNTFTPPQKTPFRAQTLLSGLLFCARCGARYSGSHGYYRCYSRSKTSTRYIVDPSCRNDDWKQEELDELIAGQIRQIALDFQKLPLAPLPVFSRREETEKRLRELSSQQQRLMDLYQSGGLPLELARERLQRIVKEQEVLRPLLEQEGENNKAFFSSDHEPFWFGEVFDKAKLETQRLIASLLIQKILLDGDSVAIYWRI